jgi:hypothetical protein
VAKQHGIKLRCYWEHLREHIENLKNILGTHWEQKKTKKSSPFPSRKPKRKNQAPKVHVEPFHWLHENSCPKLFVTIFGPNFFKVYQNLVIASPFSIFLPCKDTFMDDYDGI